jgi:hypothetical protein
MRSEVILCYVKRIRILRDIIAIERWVTLLGVEQIFLSSVLNLLHQIGYVTKSSLPIRLRKNCLYEYAREL